MLRIRSFQIRKTLCSICEHHESHAENVVHHINEVRFVLAAAIDVGPWGYVGCEVCHSRRSCCCISETNVDGEVTPGDEGVGNAVLLRNHVVCEERRA